MIRNNPMRPLGCLLLLLAAAVSLHCRGSIVLSASEKDRLDPSLRRLVAGRPLSIDTYTTSSRRGVTVYSVLISTDDAEELRAADLPIEFARSPVVPARLTIDEIRRAASLSSVRSIDNPSYASPQPGKH